MNITDLFYLNTTWIGICPQAQLQVEFHIPQENYNIQLFNPNFILFGNYYTYSILINCDANPTQMLRK